MMNDERLIRKIKNVLISD